MASKTESQHAYHVGNSAGTYNLVVYECGHCNVIWGMTQGFIDARHQDGKGWKCPNGHSWVYNDGDSVEDRLKKEKKELKDRLARNAARLDQARAELNHAASSLRTTKGHLTRQRKKLERVSNGVCPCCTRSFQNLARHMASQHPDYTPL